MTELDDILKKVDERRSIALYREASREVQRFSAQLEPARVSVLASFTIDPIVPFVVVEAARNGFAADVRIGPFNSVIQELVSPDSQCVAFQPDFVFVAHLLEDVSPRLSVDFLSLSTEQVRAEIARVVSGVVAAITTFRQRSAAMVVLHSFVPSLFGRRFLGDGLAHDSHGYVVRRLNAELARDLSAIPDVHMLDYEGLIGEFGRRGWHDKKMWYLARAPLSAAALPAVAGEYARYIAAVRRPARKCMVVDLDDTVWGGILGETGITGLKLGPDYPGNAFTDFQRALRQLRDRGVILAINSKNNFEDAQEVFLNHPQMVLRLEDFAAVRINWDPKPANMLSIANELNIGLDSIVFADDNPTERDLMRRAVPEILTLELPPNPAEFADVLADSRAFERVTVTHEDRLRTEMYRAQRERRQAEQSALSLEDFLASLEMKVTIEPASGPSLHRVGELTQKTNQFNLTTRRYTTAQIAALAADLQYGVFHVRVVDRFGDNGIVGVAIVQEKDRCAFIDTFLLSCRVIGRTIETALLAFVAQWARGRGLDGIEGEYIPTAKNAPAADFFSGHGFEQVGDDGNAKRWRLWLAHAELRWPAYMAYRDEQR